MPLLNTITTPYAEAFLQVAESRKEVDQVVDQAKAVLALWNDCPELSGAGLTRFGSGGQEGCLAKAFC